VSEKNKKVSDCAGGGGGGNAGSSMTALFSGDSGAEVTDVTPFATPGWPDKAHPDKRRAISNNRMILVVFLMLLIM